MLNIARKIIQNPLLCYLPTILIVAISITILFQYSPFLCLFYSVNHSCLLHNNINIFIYHPINIIILLLFAYTCFYLYYSIYFANHLVGRAVETIYTDLSQTLKVEEKVKQTLIWLACYLATLIFSYLILPVLIFQKRILNE